MNSGNLTPLQNPYQMNGDSLKNVRRETQTFQGEEKGISKRQNQLQTVSKKRNVTIFIKT